MRPPRLSSFPLNPVLFGSLLCLVSHAHYLCRLLMLVVHLGAGRHSSTFNEKYRKLLRRALGSDLRSAARCIEHSALTNTGYGAALDVSGAVACDATVLQGAHGVCTSLSLLAVVDACPTQVCLEEMARQAEECAQTGLLRPLVMIAPPASLGEALVLPAARALYKKYIQSTNLQDHLLTQESEESGGTDFVRAASPKSQIRVKPISLAEEETSLIFPVLDTVGYIEIGTETTAAVSLGGHWLRPKGRVSCAGIPGAGVALAGRGSVQVCCLCSGQGDDIVRMTLASHVCDQLLREALDAPALGPLLVKTIEERAKLAGIESAYVGVLATVAIEGRVQLVFCHSTESFYFGFRAADGRPRIVLSRAEAGFVSGEYSLGRLQ